MNTWKLSIKPDSKTGSDAFKICKEKSLLGLGWHHAYITKHPVSLEESKELVIEKWNKWPYQIKYLLEDVKAGDHVWLHQNGHYYLCEVIDDSILYGKDIDSNYADYDLGHARNAKWALIPDKFVLGSIQRGTIAQRTIQRILITEKETQFNKLLFKKFKDPSSDQSWEPKIDITQLIRLMSMISFEEIFSLMSPDDIEDIVSAYMQSNGWILIKSTCFRSKPKFEFSMLNKSEEIAHVQIKSGNSPDPLSPEKYTQYATLTNLIYLFSTNKKPYPGKSVNHIYTIGHDEIYSWILENLWAITLPLKMRLWIFLNQEI